ncbi:DUF58 domain-containing protein [Methyloglobulus sp.]|uniref:DUF58 domain-containing protein n=1 Tax=Methyloglobulus sp. TaxID=2518622 RepID=UPI003989BFA4
MFSAKQKEAASSPVDSKALVSVTLKSLIDLAKPASGLNLHQLTLRAQQSGGYLSAFKGRGMEFDETRLYQQGDDIRSIDWRVTARTGKTHTKLFREEREKPVFISVDNRPAMQFATRGVFKSVQAKKLAALLAWVASQQGDKIGGQIFSQSSCRELKPQNGKHSALHFLNALVIADNSAGSDFSLTQALARLSQHARPGSLVYVISDFRGMNDQVENYLMKLSEHCDVVLIFVYDPLEKGLPTQGRYRFTDDQREVVIDTSDKQRLTNYQLRFEERLQKLKRIALRRGLALIQCSTQDDPVQRLRHPWKTR